MQLLFLRHGGAVPKSDWSGDDEDRPLSAEGKLIMGEVASSVVKLQPRLDLILTSPLSRAKQTAELVGECLGAPEKVIVDKRLAPGFGLKQLEKIIRDYSEHDALMLVGHDPDLSELVRTMTGGGRLSIRKGGLAQVEVPDTKVMKGRLIALLVPVPANPLASASDTEP